MPLASRRRLLPPRTERHQAATIKLSEVRLHVPHFAWNKRMNQNVNGPLNFRVRNHFDETPAVLLVERNGDGGLEVTWRSELHRIGGAKL